VIKPVRKKGNQTIPGYWHGCFIDSIIYWSSQLSYERKTFLLPLLVYRRLSVQNKNKVVKNVIYGTSVMTLLLFLAMSLGTQTPSSAQFPHDMDGNNNSSSSNNNTSSFENRIYQGENYVKLLAKDMENRLEKGAAILELTSMLPEVKNVPSANMLNDTIEQLKGIPQNADTPKRQVAKDILEKYGEFQVVFFVMPNGDMYIEEPYSRQENLSKTNFAFRDYYKGAVNNNDTFLGNVIVSASSGQNQAVIAVPVYSGANGSLAGIWAGGLDLDDFDESLQLLNLTNNGRIVYVDNLGQLVAGSDKQSPYRNESFTSLQGFKNAVNGMSGTIKETVNGTEMLVSYHPIKAISNNWAVLLIQPYHGSSVGSSGTYALTTNNDVMENAKQEELLLQNTSESKPAPVRHPGQPSHEVVFALPLREDGKVYSGTVTFTASKPIEAEVLHTYAPEKKPDSLHGEPYHAVLPGNNSIAITQLRDMVDVPIEINGTGISSGSFDFVGNALVFHKTTGEPFTVTYTVDAIVKEYTNNQSDVG
jgi:hypothetical protein